MLSNTHAKGIGLILNVNALQTLALSCQPYSFLATSKESLFWVKERAIPFVVAIPDHGGLLYDKF